MSIFNTRTQLFSFIMAVASHLCISTYAHPSPPQEDYKTWSDYGGGLDSSKFVALDQITKSNVGDLQVAWTYSTGDGNSYLFNPIVVDDVMFVLARNNSLVALDASSGREIWIHANLPGIARRGVTYWESEDRTDRRIILQINHSIQEIDASTGRSILTFGNQGLVDLREGLGRDPKTVARIKSDTPGRVFENLILVGSATGENFLAPPGDLRAYDVRTGKLVWIFHTVPHPGEYGYDTWPKDAWRYAGGTNTWGEISVDRKRAIAYFPTGSSTYDMYGADRIGQNLFADCLVALDARTGKRLWHFQLVHHDLWDYDAAAAPQLITLHRNGDTIDAVAQATKQGFLFVFNRVTGEPIWPIEERPVPSSDVPGERAWPTQPFPTAPPPFARQRMTVDDLDPFLLTPDERTEWIGRLTNSRNDGMFTPTAWKRDTVQMPGARGGANWGNTASNPARGLVYVLTQDWPSITKIEGTDLAPPVWARDNGEGLASPGESIYRRQCEGCHGPDRMGVGTAPAIADVAAHLKFEDFRQVVVAGQGDMPAVSLEESALNELYVYLSGTHSGAADDELGPLSTPNPLVVASGGAPGGLEVGLDSAQLRARYGGGSNYNWFVGPPYPEDVEAPSVRYYSRYGLDYPYIIAPPWSSIVAYDLNKGTITWKVPLGEDRHAIAAGAKNTGVLQGGERRGIIVTSTGLLFVNCKDDKVRAFDADTGEVLWTATLPAGTEGLPAMYQVDGRQYLVVSASSAVYQGRQPRGSSGGQADAGARKTRGSYVAFALPQK